MVIKEYFKIVDKSFVSILELTITQYDGIRGIKYYILYTMEKATKFNILSINFDKIFLYNLF